MKNEADQVVTSISELKLRIEALKAILPEMQAEMRRELREPEAVSNDFDPMLWTVYLRQEIGMRLINAFLILDAWNVPPQTEAGHPAAEIAYNTIKSIFYNVFVSFTFMNNKIPNTDITGWFNSIPRRGANLKLAEMTLNIMPMISNDTDLDIINAIESARMLCIFNQWNKQPSLREKTKNLLEFMIKHTLMKGMPINLNQLKEYRFFSQNTLRREYNYEPIALKSDPLPESYRDFSGEYTVTLENKYTPLMIAVIYQLTDIVKLLLDVPGIDLTVAEPYDEGYVYTRYKKSAVEFAYNSRNTEIIDLVRKAHVTQFLNEAKTANQANFDALLIKHKHAKITPTDLSNVMVAQVQSLIALQKTDEEKAKIVVEALAKTPANTPLGNFLGDHGKEIYQRTLFLILKSYATPQVIESGSHTGKLSQITPAVEKTDAPKIQSEADNKLNKLL